MTKHSILAACGLAAALVGCATGSHTQRTQAATLACAGLPNGSAAGLYGPSKLSKVEPIERQIFLARAIQPTQVFGARLYVPADREYHPAFLERVLSCQLNSGTGASDLSNDPLRVAGVEHVSVEAAGPNVRISIVGKDAKAGRAIWKSARALSGEGQVTVEQMASAEATHGNF